MKRHLGKCHRCRARIVRVASGGRLGDTAVQDRRGVSPWLKAIPVAVCVVAVVVVVFRWLQGAPPQPSARVDLRDPVAVTEPARRELGPVEEAIAVEAAPTPSKVDPCPPVPPALHPAVERVTGHRRTASAASKAPLVEPSPSVTEPVDAHLAVLDGGRLVRTTLD